MKPSRRSFLEAGLTLPVLLGASPSFASAAQSYESGTSNDSSFDPWVEIHRENLRHNVQDVRERQNIAGNQFADRLAVDKLRGDEVNAIQLSDFMNCKYVWMV